MNIYQTLLMYVVWFLSTYFVILFILLIFKYRVKLFESKKEKFFTKLPFVSFVVPAYNEEKTIIACLQSLEKLDYPGKKFEVIVINDGSKDNTGRVVKKFINTTKKNFKLLNHRKNKGKANRLNEGIGKAVGKYIVCMDADTTVTPTVLKKSLKYFYSEKIGAVTVAIDVRANNFLQKITAIEYDIGISLSIGILSKLSSVHVTPGPFTIYRANVLREIGGFDEKNITEDMEIAYRIHKYGYDIKCALDAKVTTNVPENLKQLYKQRKRWYTGALQTLNKHRDVVFNKELGIFGYFVPYNFSLILLGLLLFIVSTLISAYNQYRSISFYRFTGFNFFQHLFDFNLDILSIFNIFSILIMISFALTGIMTFIGLRTLKKSLRKNLMGYVGFLPFFILYQIFWTVSLYAFVFKRDVTWR